MQTYVASHIYACIYEPMLLAFSLYALSTFVANYLFAHIADLCCQLTLCTNCRPTLLSAHTVDLCC